MAAVVYTAYPQPETMLTNRLVNQAIDFCTKSQRQSQCSRPNQTMMISKLTVQTSQSQLQSQLQLQSQSSPSPSYSCSCYPQSKYPYQFWAHVQSNKVGLEHAISWSKATQKKIKGKKIFFCLIWLKWKFRPPYCTEYVL